MQRNFMHWNSHAAGRLDFQTVVTQPMTAQLVKQWLDIDINPVTRNQILQLKDSHDDESLQQLLGSRITFGTAGLRSKMEAGFNRINWVTVLQTSQGLAKYVLGKNPARPSVVIGHDHRHNSEDFAQITASVFLTAGFQVYYLENSNDSEDSGLAATPFVPFAVDFYRASCGVMITASHNPAADNGYKVYWNNGCQIIPPNDAGIAGSILQNLVPWPSVWSTFQRFADVDNPNLVKCKDQVKKNYYAKLAATTLYSDDFSDYGKIKFVYTPMHGVGYEFVKPIFADIFKVPHHVVEQQLLPDPDFRTVKFPNPEEKGALDLAIETANQMKLDLIVANDPDADRFSAAVRTGPQTFRQLTGNELGFLFAYYTVQNIKDLSKVYLLNSTVSSQMIKSMAEHLGFKYQDTLTGFKWIGNKAIDLAEQGFHVPFGYEEAIGFMFPNVHDKDGLAALTVFLQLYYHWTIKHGMPLTEVLEAGYKQFGCFKEFNGYYKFDDLSVTEKIFKAVRSTYAQAPQTLGNFKVKSWRDLTTGYDSSTQNNVPVLPVDTSSQMITGVVYLESPDEFVRFTARGSGTEPKLKVYVEGKATTETRALALARQLWDTLKQQWFQPDVYNLQEVHP